MYFKDEGFIGEASHTFMKVKELLEHGIIELWPNGLIPYRLSEQFTKKEKADIETAIQIIEQVKTLEFRTESFQLLIFDDSVQEIIQIQPLE